MLTSVASLSFLFGLIHAQLRLGGIQQLDWPVSNMYSFTMSAILLCFSVLDVYACGISIPLSLFMLLEKSLRWIIRESDKPRNLVQPADCVLRPY